MIHYADPRHLPEGRPSVRWTTVHPLPTAAGQPLLQSASTILGMIPHHRPASDPVHRPPPRRFERVGSAETEATNAPTFGRLGGEGWLAGLLTLLPVTLAGLSLLAASNGNVTVFKTLVTTLNVPAILITSYVTALPVFLPVAFAVHAFFLMVRAGLLANVRRDRRTFSFWMSFIIVDVMFIPHGVLDWIIISIAVASGLTFVIIVPQFMMNQGGAIREILSSAADRHARGMARELLRDVPLAAVVALLLTQMALLNGMWLPPEVIAIKGQSPISAGYVLQESENELLIYWADARGVQRYRADRIEYRQICEMKPHNTYSLVPNQSPRPRQQPCPLPDRH